jgi:hydrogenase maturation factor HypE
MCEIELRALSETGGGATTTTAIARLVIRKIEETINVPIDLATLD